MAWEWVPPVSAAGGAVLGAWVGAVTTWLTAKGTRDHALELARADRQQQRFAEAYLDLVTYLEHFGQWAHTLRPLYEPAGHERRPMPSAEQQARCRALVAAYGSDAIKGLYKSYNETIGEIINADLLIGLALQSGRDAGVNEPEQWERLRGLLKQESERREQIADQVSAELST
ncbi:hypothetical protein ACIA5G_07165 [Amycolatopsis sp. NPDC051758]|uniref:hypothetical protein n=1 Tax=Amycolatopsis sp. NPDC051758 TaxID=3363935 RepID=UPI00379C3F81